MLTTTTLELEGFRIVQYRGVVCGVGVRTPTITQGIFGRIKNMVGGEIDSLTDLSEEAHREAYERMVEEATTRRANAVINIRYDTAMLEPKMSASEVCCYGTAVVVELDNKKAN